MERDEKDIKMPGQSDKHLIRKQLAPPNIVFLYLSHLLIYINFKSLRVCQYSRGVQNCCQSAASQLHVEVLLIPSAQREFFNGYIQKREEYQK